MPEAADDLDRAIARVLGRRGPVELSDLTAKVRQLMPTITRSDVRQCLIAGEGERYVLSQVGWSVIPIEREIPPLRPALTGGTKQGITDELCSLVGIDPIPLGPGSTEPKRLLVEVAVALGLPPEARLTKLDIARSIVAAAGHQWLVSFDSTSSESGGGGTITTEGLIGVLEAARALTTASHPPAARDAVAGGIDTGRAPKKRNPTWVADELILALDLYLDAGLVGPSDPRVVELSELLNMLPIHDEAVRRTKFRNPKGVGLKLANFASLDPNHEGRGMEHGSKGDQEIWERFSSDREELRLVASQIRILALQADRAAMSPVDDEEAVAEGRLLFRLHRSRERDPVLASRKRAEVMAREGVLRCEGCGFDFADAYGLRGEGFIEVHHLVPMSVGGPRTTRLADLAVLCANCHRMVHRGEPWLDLDELQALAAHE